MSEAEDRAVVVAIAMQWEGTPYVHQGRIKGQCADCTFFAKVFEEANLIPPVTIPFYGAQAYINRQASIYLQLVERHAQREVTADTCQPGDIVMFNIARSFSHGAIVIDPGWPSILHADMAARHVIRGNGEEGVLRGRERRFFSFW